MSSDSHCSFLSFCVVQIGLFELHFNGKNNTNHACGWIEIHSCMINFIKELQFLYIPGIRLRCNGLLSCGKLIHWRNMDVQMMWLYSSEVTGHRAGRIVAAAGEKISCFLTLKFRSKIVNGYLFLAHPSPRGRRDHRCLCVFVATACIQMVKSIFFNEIAASKS
jgi:hypothetical protein